MVSRGICSKVGLMSELDPQPPAEGSPAGGPRRGSAPARDPRALVCSIAGTALQPTAQPAPVSRGAEILKQELRAAQDRADAAEAQRDRLFAHVIEAERLPRGSPVKGPMPARSIWRRSSRSCAPSWGKSSARATPRTDATPSSQPSFARRRVPRAPAARRSGPRSFTPTGCCSARTLRWASCGPSRGRRPPRSGWSWPAWSATSTPATCPCARAPVSALGVSPPALSAPVVAAALGREKDTLLWSCCAWAAGWA